MDNFLWTELYRPKTVDECILPKHLKDTFKQFITNKEIPNIILSGRPGVGKTTVAKAMLNELGYDFLFINGSLYGNIDTLRNEIMQFAATVSLTGGRKYVILDEADHLNPNSTQPALRSFMEEFASNCGFILTCNYKNKIIEPLISRCGIIDFKISKDEKVELAKEFFKRIKKILDNHKIKYDKKVVLELIIKHFPDWRRIINELQRFSANSNGVIDSSILVEFTESSFKNLMTSLKTKSYTNMRKWVAENQDIDSAVLFDKLFTAAQQYIAPEAIPDLVVILGEYQYKDAFVVNKEINIVACLTEIMVTCKFI